MPVWKPVRKEGRCIHTWSSISGTLQHFNVWMVKTVHDFLSFSKPIEGLKQCPFHNTMWTVEYISLYGINEEIIPGDGDRKISKPAADDLLPLIEALPYLRSTWYHTTWSWLWTSLRNQDYIAVEFEISLHCISNNTVFWNTLKTKRALIRKSVQSMTWSGKRRDSNELWKVCNSLEKRNEMKMTSFCYSGRDVTCTDIWQAFIQVRSTII